VPTLSDNKEQLKLFNSTEKKALALYGQIPTYCGPTMGAYAKGLANVGPAGFATVLKENVGWEK
ncbi:MAG: ABC transporter family substrate-binding protein, partial [Parascardovia denticolens]